MNDKHLSRILLGAGMLLAATGLTSSAGMKFDGRVSLGTRLSVYRLFDSRDADGFVGSITDLEESQNLAPYKLFGVYRFDDSWGLELAWDSIRARTRNSYNNDTDGAFELSGPMLGIRRFFAGQTALIPFIGADLVFMRGDFDSAAWWRNGYQNADDYAALGPEPRNSTMRHMEVDDSWGLGVSGGCDLQVSERVALDMIIRFVKIDTGVGYSISRGGKVVDSRDAGGVPFDYLAIGFGGRVLF